VDSNLAGHTVGRSWRVTRKTVKRDWVCCLVLSAGLVCAVACGSGTPVNSQTVSTPDFSIAVGPTSQSVVAGSSTTYNVTLTSQNGYGNTVTLSILGLPAGVTPSFAPPSLIPTGTSTLTVSTASTTPVGTFTLTITGSDGTLTHSTAVSLLVRSASATISFVTGSGGAGNFNGTSGPITITSTGSGNDIIVGIATLTAAVNSVTDNVANAYRRVNSQAQGTTAHIELWAARNSIPGATSIMVTISASGECEVVAGEYAGVGGYGMVTLNSSGSGGSTTASANRQMSTGGGVAVMVAGAGGAGTFSAGANTTLRHSGATGAGSDVGAALSDRAAASGVQGPTTQNSVTISVSETWATAALELQAVVPPAPVVQFGISNTITSGTTLDCYFALANTASNAIIVALRYPNGGTVSSVADDTGDSFSSMVGPQADTGAVWKIQVFAAFNIGAQAAPNRVRTTFTTSQTDESCAVFEVQLRTTDPAAEANGTGTALDSGATTTTNANDFLFGLGNGAAGNLTAGTNWTGLVFAFGEITAEIQNVSTIGSYHATFTDGTSENWTAQIAAFQH
jgi:hypothetical protein